MYSTSTPQTDSLVAFFSPTANIWVKNWPYHEVKSRHQSELTWTFICAMVLLSSIFLDNPMKFRGLNHSSCLHFKKNKKPDLRQPTRPHTKNSVWFSKNPNKPQQSADTGQKIRGEQTGPRIELALDVFNQVGEEEKRLHSQPEQGVVPWPGKKWVARPWDP